MNRLLAAFCGLLMLLSGSLGTAHAADPIGDALDRVIAAAREQAARDCTAPDDRLVAILCAGQLRVGVRRDYPQFSLLAQEGPRGFEIDIARAIGKKLGVAVEFTGVTAANRIPLLAEGEIDIAIAAMGHTIERGKQIDFVRPHYFRSETIIVGSRDLPIAGWGDIAGRTVCVSVGNFTNTELIRRHARLLLFEDPGQLLDQLRFETCSLIAQDDSFFAAFFADPEFAQRYEAKLRFAPLPWGIGVARQGGDRLQLALSLLSQTFHRDGVFLAMAREHNVPTGFLEAQQKLWSGVDCDRPDGWRQPGCVLEPPDNVLAPTPFADRVTAFETLIRDGTGIAISLPMLKTASAFSLLRSGVVNSLILVVGALAATLAVAFVVGAALSAPNRVLRGVLRAPVILVQSSPIVLLLFLAFVVASSMVQYSASVALFASIVTIGLYNGCYAGQAIAEATATLRLESMGAPVRYDRAVRRSTTQIMAFLVNATKGSAIASMIGAPELLNTLTDITSFSSERATTYTLLLIFYSVLVGAVVWLTDLARRAYEGRGQAA